MVRRRVSPPIVRWLSGLLASVMMVAAVSGHVVLLNPHVPALYLLVLYLLVVMLVAIVWGTGFAAVTAVLSVAVYAYLFLPPLLSFGVADSSSIFALGVFLVTAVVVGNWGLGCGGRRWSRHACRRSSPRCGGSRHWSRSRSPSAAFEAVTREVGLLCGADLARMQRYEEDGTVTGVAVWSRTPDQLAVGTRFKLDGLSVAREVQQTGGPGTHRS